MDLLENLNRIADLAIGNEAPEDVGYNDRTTLPELLCRAMTHKDDRPNLVKAEEKLKEIDACLHDIRQEITMLKKKIDIKRNK